MPYIEAAASIIPVRVKDSKAKANDASAISRQAGRSPRYPPSPLSPYPNDYWYLTRVCTGCARMQTFSMLQTCVRAKLS